MSILGASILFFPTLDQTLNGYLIQVNPHPTRQEAPIASTYGPSRTSDHRFSKSQGQGSGFELWPGSGSGSA